MSSSPAKKSAGIAALIVHHSITVLILVLFLVLGVWSYLTFQNADFFASVDRQAHVNEFRPAVVEAQSQRLHFAIEVYQQLTGRTPANLSELVEKGFLRESDLYYPGGPNIWVYERLPDGFRLTRENPES